MSKKSEESPAAMFVLIRHMSRSPLTRTRRALRSGHRRHGFLLSDGTRVRRKNGRLVKVSLSVAGESAARIIDGVANGVIEVLDHTNVKISLKDLELLKGLNLKGLSHKIVTCTTVAQAAANKAQVSALSLKQFLNGNKNPNEDHLKRFKAAQKKDADAADKELKVVAGLKEEKLESWVVALGAWKSSFSDRVESTAKRAAKSAKSDEVRIAKAKAAREAAAKETKERNEDRLARVRKARALKEEPSEDDVTVVVQQAKAEGAKMGKVDLDEPTVLTPAEPEPTVGTSEVAAPPEEPKKEVEEPTDEDTLQLSDITPKFLKGLKRGELNELAANLSIDEPEKLSSAEKVTAAILEAVEILSDSDDEGDDDAKN